jgi:hypothetical protein
METVYTMPKWAIDLVTMAKGNNTSESRLLALDVLQFQQDCPDGLADEIVYHSDHCLFEESLVFGKEERGGFTHAVFNGKDRSEFKSGKPYPVRDVTDTYFECMSEFGDWLFCLRKDCAFVYPYQWTLVRLESE